MEQWIKVGKILKTKGFDGTTIVSFDYPVLEDSFKAFFIQKNNIYSPLLISQKEKIDENTYHIQWLNYHSKEIAQALHNRELYIDEGKMKQYFDEEVWEDFIGYEVYNDEEKLGVVVDLYNNEFQETLEVMMDGDKKLLIPLIDEYILTIDDEKETIYCHLGQDYIELFSS